MEKKKATYNQISRQDISSKNHSVPYSTLLELAKVEIFTSPPTIERLENGRIIVHVNQPDDAQSAKSISNVSSEKKKRLVKKQEKKQKKKEK